MTDWPPRWDIDWYYHDDWTAIACGDCLELLPKVPEGWVGLIIADPPYFRIKGEAWDRQWKNADLFLAWLDALFVHWHRILQPNGSIYTFASPQMAGRIEHVLTQRFNVLNHLVWRKSAGLGAPATWGAQTRKEDLRAFFPASERILFAEHYNSDNTAINQAGYAQQCDQLRGFVFEPLRAYLDGERRRSNTSKAMCNKACGFSETPGGMASRHYFSRSQWCLPTKAHYHALQQLFNTTDQSEYLRREYEELRREYEELRREYEELRRPFNLQKGQPWEDIWDFNPLPPGNGRHPCAKPPAMLKYMIHISSQSDTLVLDCCMGHGSTLHAAKDLNRRAIGFELSEEYCAIAADRLRQETLAFPERTP